MLEYRLSQIAVFATFVLLLIGGTVNPTGSSLACPEPTLVCHGQLFPEMTGGVLYEHGHRLAAMTVGFLQIFLTILVWRRRPALRRVGVLALAMVCVQGALGAVTVGFKLPWMVSTAHLLLAMLYLATLIYLSTSMAVPDPGDSKRSQQAFAVLPWLAVAGGVLLAQILLGGLVRHHEAALASIDLPLHHGSLWPAGAALPLKLHMAHRIGGVITALVLVAVGTLVFTRSSGWSALRRRSAALALMVLCQVGLGLLVIMSFRAVPVAVVHFGGAALLWALLASLWWRAWRAGPGAVSEAVPAVRHEQSRHGVRQ